MGPPACPATPVFSVTHASYVMVRYDPTMMRWLVRFLGFALVMLAWVKVASAQSRCPFNTTGTIEAGDATQDGRLKNGPTSTCIAPTTAPGVLTPAQKVRFDKYTLKNRTAAAQCVTIAVTGTAAAGVQSATYAPAFDTT